VVFGAEGIGGVFGAEGIGEVGGGGDEGWWGRWGR